MASDLSTNSQQSLTDSSLKIAVLAGGIGSEKEVSIQSGGCIAEGLRKSGFVVIVSDVTPENMDILSAGVIVVFFVALLGKFGEVGQLQQILEDRSLIYTGSGPAASRLAIDKMASKEVFRQAGIKTPDAVEFRSDIDAEQLCEQLRPVSGRYVVKPVTEGSSVGISIVESCDQAIETAKNCIGQFGDCMIEEFIDGREIAVSVLGSEALDTIEITAAGGFYDYHAKYIDEKTQYRFGTIKDEALEADIKRIAVECFERLGCKGFGRVDFFLDNNRCPWVLEVNTIPGFTTHSLLPMAAARAGLSMGDLCSGIIEDAIADKKLSAFTK